MKKICSLLLLLSTHTAFAKNNEEQRIWLGFFAQKKMSINYDLWLEAQLRHDESNQTMNQTLNRFGLLRSFNKHHELGLLFAYVQSGLTKEYRPTLQYVYKNNWTGNILSVRNRLEGRDIENNDANSLRLRTLLRWARPISKNRDFVFWEEPFLNLTHESWTGNRFIERNRAFTGVRIKFDQVECEVGYMNQYVPRKSQDLLEHILTVYLFF